MWHTHFYFTYTRFGVGKEEFKLFDGQQPLAPTKLFLTFLWPASEDQAEIWPLMLVQPPTHPEVRILTQNYKLDSKESKLWSLSDVIAGRSLPGDRCLSGQHWGGSQHTKRSKKEKQECFYRVLVSGFPFLSKLVLVGFCPLKLSPVFSTVLGIITTKGKWTLFIVLLLVISFHRS